MPEVAPADPFGWWLDLWNGGVRLAETAQASAEVVDSRSRSMMDAMHDPLNGDYAELGRMIPEKMDAFGQAGASAFRDLCALQADALANWRQLGAMALRGTATSGELAAIASRSSRMVARASAAGGKALAPVHRRATANARRLKRGR